MWLSVYGDVDEFTKVRQPPRGQANANHNGIFRRQHRFSELLAVQDLNLSLFDDLMKQMRLAYLIDELNERFEAQAVQVGGLHGTGGLVPKRIPFGAPDTK